MELDIIVTFLTENFVNSAPPENLFRCIPDPSQEVPTGAPKLAVTQASVHYKLSPDKNWFIEICCVLINVECKPSITINEITKRYVLKENIK